MREIIQIGLGQCGVRVALKQFELLAAEYGVENTKQCEKPVEGMEVHFSEIGEKKYVPRSILMSKDTDQILAQPLGLLFNPNNYQLGFQEILRKELEICNNCQGFQISLHLSTDLLKDFEIDEKKIVQAFTVFPQLDNAIDVTRSAANLEQLRQYNMIAFDNQGLLDYYQKTYKNLISYQDYNFLIAQVMNGVTTPMRYPSSNNMSLEKLYAIQSPLNIELCRLFQDKSSIITTNSLIEMKPLIQVDSVQKHKCIQSAFLFKSSQVQPFHLQLQMKGLKKYFYNDVPNIQFSITNSKSEQIVQLFKSSHIGNNIEELVKIIQKAKPRKPFSEQLNWETLQFERADEIINICQEIINTHQDVTEEQEAKQQTDQREQSTSKPLLIQSESKLQTNENKQDLQLSQANERNSAVQNQSTPQQSQRKLQEEN